MANQKTIVTHINPDLDAIGSVWLLRSFHPQFAEAQLAFVPAGSTYKNQPPDGDDSIVHVDTGLGRFDHHQRQEKTCAAELVLKWLTEKRPDLEKDKALLRLIEVIRGIDHFENALWPEATSDRYQFLIDEVLNGLKSAGQIDDQGLVELGSQLLSGAHTALKIKVKAEEDLKEGYEFISPWGKAIGCLTANNGVIKLGQKQGYVLVVQKDTDTNHIRIKGRPDSEVDLTQAKHQLEKLDPEATWFLHISKRMLLNGSTKNPETIASKLGLAKVIKVLEAEQASLGSKTNREETSKKNQREDNR